MAQNAREKIVKKVNSYYESLTKRRDATSETVIHLGAEKGKSYASAGFVLAENWHMVIIEHWYCMGE